MDTADLVQAGRPIGCVTTLQSGRAHVCMNPNVSHLVIEPHPTTMWHTPSLSDPPPPSTISHTVGLRHCIGQSPSNRSGRRGAAVNLHLARVVRAARHLCTQHVGFTSTGLNYLAMPGICLLMLVLSVDDVVAVLWECGQAVPHV